MVLLENEAKAPAMSTGRGVAGIEIPGFFWIIQGKRFVCDGACIKQGHPGLWRHHYVTVSDNSGLVERRHDESKSCSGSGHTREKVEDSYPSQEIPWRWGAGSPCIRLSQTQDEAAGSTSALHLHLLCLLRSEAATALPVTGQHRQREELRNCSPSLHGIVPWDP